LGEFTSVDDCGKRELNRVIYDMWQCVDLPSSGASIGELSRLVCRAALSSPHLDDFEIHRSNFFNKPKILWNDVRRFWDSLITIQKCPVNILEIIQNN
jgi:hypothetical protein